MSATSKKQVYNFKGAFNCAMQQIMAAAGLTAQIERSNATLPTSRVEVTFDMGDATNQAYIVDPTASGLLTYDYFQGCKLSVRICTLRPQDQPSALRGIATLHDEFCGTMYAIMEERLRPFDAYLPYYQVNMIRPRGTQSGLDGTFMEDWTLITFEVWFGIRPNAWPLVCTPTENVFLTDESGFSVLSEAGRRILGDNDP